MAVRGLLIAAALALAAGGAFWVWGPAAPDASVPSASREATSQPAAADASRAGASSPDGRSDPAGRSEVAAARTAFEAARDQHADALAELDRVTRSMEGLEEEVAEVERYVQGLESRGEDPADHAFEAMDRVRPVLERYQALVEAWDRAQSEEIRTRAELEDAERALAEAASGG